MATNKLKIISEVAHDKMLKRLKPFTVSYLNEYLMDETAALNVSIE
jgi:hypothetical protein